MVRAAKTRIVHLLHYRRLGAGAMVVCAVVIAASMTACMVRPTLKTPRRHAGDRRSR
ncbi:MAG: hypothetical protein ACLVHY_01350 [Gemmiger sp.]